MFGTEPSVRHQKSLFLLPISCSVHTLTQASTQNPLKVMVLIGSPLKGQPAQRTGDVYKCPVGHGSSSSCIKLDLPDNTTIPNIHEVKANMTMGTTLVANPDGNGFLACGPQYGYMCGNQQYITGICSNVSSSFQVLNSIAPTVQDCKQDMDIVIVLDGSNSIFPWRHITDFLVKFLKKIEIPPAR
ncbi:integrin alpha-1, partial [Tachysurus ichikawai]